MEEPGEGYGRERSGEGTVGTGVLGPLCLALVSPAQRVAALPEGRCRPTAAHVAGGGGAVSASTWHTCASPDLMLSMAWLASTRRSQEDHVRPAPQTPPLPLGPTHCLVLGTPEPPSAGSFHRAGTLLQGSQVCYPVQSRSGMSPLTHSTPSRPPRPSPPGVFHQEIRVGAPQEDPHSTGVIDDLPTLSCSFKDFYELEPHKFQNKTNGITLGAGWLCVTLGSRGHC